MSDPSLDAPAPSHLQEEDSLRADPQPLPLTREEFLAILASLRTHLQRDLDTAELLVERLRAGSSDLEEVSVLDTVVAEKLAPALRTVCLIEEGAFFTEGP